VRVVYSFARLLAKLPRPGDREVTFAVFESSCQQSLLTQWYRGNPINSLFTWSKQKWLFWRAGFYPANQSCLTLLFWSCKQAISAFCLDQGCNKWTCLPIFTLSLFYAEHQAGKLWIPIKYFGLTRPVIEPRSTYYESDALV